jgi:sugar lactone lactonase YvrE
MLTKWFEVADRRFEDLILSNVHGDTLFSEGRWPEGPVYVPAGRYLLVSDIPNDRVMRSRQRSICALVVQGATGCSSARPDPFTLSI